MINTQVEKINPISSFEADKSLQLLLEKAYSPYKPTLKKQVREDSLLKYLYNYSKRLYELAIKNPNVLTLIKAHPEILNELYRNDKLLDFILRHPSMLEDYIKDPKKFTNAISEEGPAKTNKAQQSDSFNRNIKVKIKEQSLTNKEVNITKNINENKTAAYEPHELEPSIIAKAHIENPNTRASIGIFRNLSTNGLRNIESPTISTRGFSSNPALAALLGAASATANFLKIKSSEEKRFETETQSELENSRQETLEEVSGVQRSETSNRISTKLQ